MLEEIKNLSIYSLAKSFRYQQIKCADVGIVNVWTSPLSLVLLYVGRQIPILEKVVFCWQYECYGYFQEL